MLVEHGLGVCGSVLFSVESLLLGTIFFFFFTYFGTSPYNLHLPAV